MVKPQPHQATAGVVAASLSTTKPGKAAQMPKFADLFLKKKSKQVSSLLQKLAKVRVYSRVFVDRLFAGLTCLSPLRTLMAAEHACRGGLSSLSLPADADATKLSRRLCRTAPYRRTRLPCGCCSTSGRRSSKECTRALPR
jgi:hypothetical protein